MQCFAKIKCYSVVYFNLTSFSDHKIYKIRMAVDGSIIHCARFAINFHWRHFDLLKNNCQIVAISFFFFLFFIDYEDKGGIRFFLAGRVSPPPRVAASYFSDVFSYFWWVSFDPSKLQGFVMPFCRDKRSLDTWLDDGRTRRRNKTLSLARWTQK